MKLRNNGESFEMTYNGRDVVIPTGDFEVSSPALGIFIQKVSMKWGRGVIITREEQPDVKQDIKIKEEITPIKKEVEDVVEEAKQVITEAKKKVNEKPKAKASKKIEELENSL